MPQLEHNTLIKLGTLLEHMEGHRSPNTHRSFHDVEKALDLKRYCLVCLTRCHVLKLIFIKHVVVLCRCPKCIRPIQGAILAVDWAILQSFSI